MPLYEYQCKKCEKKFETLVSFSNSDAVECPDCGSQETNKLLSTFSAFVGSSASTPSCRTSST